MVEAQGVGDPSARSPLLSPDGRLAAGCATCYELRLHRARGYGALKAILEILAQEEPLTLTEVAQRLKRTPGSTKDYLSWLEDVDLIVSQRKRYSFGDPLLRLWVRLYCRPSGPSTKMSRARCSRMRSRGCRKPEPAMVVAGGGGAELADDERKPWGIIEIRLTRDARSDSISSSASSARAPSRAASCSASFLLPPAASAIASPPTRTATWNSLE